MSRVDLVSDCGNCSAICCIATSFEVSEEFACDKPAGEPCRHLKPRGRCGIHAERIQRGFAGCTVYECYGAGPRITRAFGDVAPIDIFHQLRALHELLWLVTEAAKVCPAQAPAALRAELAQTSDSLDELALRPFDTLRALDLRPVHAQTHAVLRRVGKALGGRTALRVLTQPIV